MKQTEEDRVFAGRFARALQRFVSEERERGKSLAAIAKGLGVTAPGLQRQLRGGTPSVRTVALAYATYGVSVRYGDVNVTGAISGRRWGRKKKRGEPSEQQLVLPLEITAPPSSRGLLLKPVLKSLRRYRLQITVGMAG